MILKQKAETYTALLGLWQSLDRLDARDARGDEIIQIVGGEYSAHGSSTVPST